MSGKWVERIRYSEGFASEEEARKWLEEGLRWFEDIEREMRAFHERMFRLTESIFKPYYPTEYTAKPEDLISRIEKLENELRELKELVRQKYLKAKVEIR